MPLWKQQFSRQEHRHNPGRFRNALTLRAPSGDHATPGDFQPSWTEGDGIEVNGHWRQTSQREMAIDGGKFSSASGVWEIPWLPDITQSYRVEFGTRKYRIVGLHNPNELNRELHLYVVEDEGAKGADE